MSPSAALESPVFRTYVIAVLSVLVIAGVAIAVVQFGLKRNVASVWKTYTGWLIMIPLVVGCLFLGRYATIGGLCLVSIFGVKEFARATGLYRDWWLTGIVYLGVIGLFILAAVTDPRLGSLGWYGLYMVMPVYVVCLTLAIPIVRDRTKGHLQQVSLAILGFVYIGWMFGHLALLTNREHAYEYLLFLILAVELNDVAAFTCGKLFGKRRLLPNISPNKTWAGSIGAAVFSMAFVFAMQFTFPHFGPLQLVLTGLIIGVGGQFGDLSISFIKRDIGVKDMGAAIPGHGGILDRIDSLIFVAPLFFHMTRWFYG